MASRKDLLAMTTADLLTYSQGVIDLAEAHLAHLPGALARAARLRAQQAELQGNHLEWAEDTVEQRASTSARNAAFADGLRPYSTLRAGAELLVADGAGGEALPALLAACLAPSHLRPAAAFLAFEEMARVSEAHGAAFASVDIDAAAEVASLRAAAQALQATVNQRAATTREKGESSSLRKDARSSLIAQLRTMEKYLRQRLPPAGLAGLEALRSTFRPRYPQTAPENPGDPAA